MQASRKKWTKWQFFCYNFPQFERDFGFGIYHFPFGIPPKPFFMSFRSLIYTNTPPIASSPRIKFLQGCIKRTFKVVGFFSGKLIQFYLHTICVWRMRIRSKICHFEPNSSVYHLYCHGKESKFGVKLLRPRTQDLSFNPRRAQRYK